MKKLKIILPMLAFVLAIGMSFAFTSATEEDFYATKYIQTNNGWETIEVNCSPGSAQCIVTFEDDPSGIEYQVFDQENDEFPTAGTGAVILLPGDGPSL